MKDRKIGFGIFLSPMFLSSKWLRKEVPISLGLKDIAFQLRGKETTNRSTDVVLETSLGISRATDQDSLLHANR